MAAVSLLVGSFHNRLQLLDFTPGNASSEDRLALRSVDGPPFETYTWIESHPTIPDLFYAAQALSTRDGIISVLKITVPPEHVEGAGRASFEILQSVSSHGIDPCHLGINTDATELASANYDSSNVSVYRLQSDGLIHEEAQVHEFAGNDKVFVPGPSEPRQDAPHPHGCFYSHALQDWIIPDLGADRLRLLRQSGFLPCRNGAGPRHVALNEGGGHVYAVNELDNTVTIHGLFDGVPPTERRSVLPSDAPATGVTFNAAAILLSKDNSTLYITNRLEGHPEGDALVWFKVSQDGKALSRQGELRTGLDHPRGAALFSDAEGREYLITGSKTQKGAVVYRLDTTAGTVTEVARNNEVVQPSCFVKI